jgi:hypothetical protein
MLLFLWVAAAPHPYAAGQPRHAAAADVGHRVIYGCTGDCGRVVQGEWGGGEHDIVRLQWASYLQQPA